MERTTRVLIAEDHATVRGAIRMLLEAEPGIDVIGEAGNGEDAVTLAKELRPDVILMDISMPDLDGAQATRRIKNRLPETKIVVLTRHYEDGYLKKLLGEGADGYVLKQSSSSVMIDAIRHVTSGNSFLDPQVAAGMISEMNARPESQGSTENVVLSPREISVIRLYSLGYSIGDIAIRLDLSTKSIETCKANVLKKLGISTRVEIVRFAIDRGWMKDT